jgi:hypothetical protein
MSSLLVPNRNSFAITPTDGVRFIETSELYVGGAGNIAVRWADDPAIVKTLPVAAGERLAWSIVGVEATGTTATGIIGFRNR